MSHFKMQIMSIFQNLLLKFGIFARPKNFVSYDFILEFLAPRNIGIDLIMIGDGSDGTYVLPNDIEDIKFCFSPGVGPTSQFEIGLYDRFGIKSFLIDASVNSVKSNRKDFFDFEQKFLGACTFDQTISLKDWVLEKLGPRDYQDCILQMDIEGAEYSSLLATDNEILKRFRIILLEIHGLDLVNISVCGFILEQLCRKLSENFIVCYARANDCCGTVELGCGKKIPRVMELSLIRKDRVKFVNDTPLSSFDIKNI